MLKQTLFITGLIFACLSCKHEPVEPEAESIVPTNENIMDTCISSNISFTSNVFPIINTRCATPGCHSGSSPASGIGLEDYTQVKAMVDYERLIGTIDHQPGFSPMPKAQAKLDSCYISMVKTWVLEGAQNN